MIIERMYDENQVLEWFPGRSYSKVKYARVVKITENGGIEFGQRGDRQIVNEGVPKQ